MNPQNSPQPAPIDLWVQPNRWLAERAYTAYGRVTGGKNYQGLPMPDFSDLGETIQRAWINAAATVRRTVVDWQCSRENVTDVPLPQTEENAL